MHIFLFIIALLIVIPGTQACSQDYNGFIQQANSLYQEGKYKEAAEIYEKAIATGEAKVNDYYNCACCWSLAGDTNKAFDNLNKAIDNGFIESDWIAQDTDFENIREDKRFDLVINKIDMMKIQKEEALPEKHSILETVTLPKWKTKGEMSVEETMQNRRSVRRYKPEPVSMEELSQVLWAAYGLTKPIEGGPAFLRGGLRAAPSAGALYPLDIYVVAGDVDGLEDGIYLYDSEKHELGLLQKGDFRKELCDAANGQIFVEQAPFTLVYSAIFDRTTKKYGKRGRERYVCMDLGHSGQNVYLQCTALGLGTCAVGAFSDFNLRILINMTRQEEPLYLMPVGRLTD